MYTQPRIGDLQGNHILYVLFGTWLLGSDPINLFSASIYSMLEFRYSFGLKIVARLVSECLISMVEKFEAESNLI